jgi:hypothetical protein
MPGIAPRAVGACLWAQLPPLVEVWFDLVIPGGAPEAPTVGVMLDVLTSRTFRRDLAALPGYEVLRTGSTVMRLEAA